MKISKDYIDSAPNIPVVAAPPVFSRSLDDVIVLRTS